MAGWWTNNKLEYIWKEARIPVFAWRDWEKTRNTLVPEKTRNTLVPTEMKWEMAYATLQRTQADLENAGVPTKVYIPPFYTYHRPIQELK
jgi:hypothetical protein